MRVVGQWFESTLRAPNLHPEMGEHTPYSDTKQGHLVTAATIGFVIPVRKITIRIPKPSGPEMAPFFM